MAKDALGHEGGKGREGERERVDELEARAREKETVLKGLQDFCD